MKYNKSTIMKRAHELYWERRGLDRRYTFGRALKSAWASAKWFMERNESSIYTISDEEPKKAEEPVKKAVWGYKVPMWLMVSREVSSYGMFDGMPFIPEKDITRETKKAFMAYGEWFPTSQCKYCKAA